MKARKNKDNAWIMDDKIPVDRYDLQGPILSIIEALSNVRSKALSVGMVGEGRIYIEVGRSYYDGDYELEINYEFVRAENDVERGDRLADEARVKAEAAAKRKAAAEKKKIKEDPEYAEFERLKAKFGSV